ncbi:unnamed protein product [Menidia menidia]|uniref:(Atlantic silverside) hypothetical protein n=1 Tax=Menidia menidia TaxID=238744 RepID=A0A8S4B6L4_9TELE|nr:unnamed protein product [Menidia menidia]
MSQEAPSAAEPCSDTTPTPDPPLHADPGPCQDVPSALTSAPAPPEPPLIPDSADVPQSNREKAEEDKNNASEGQTEPPAEGQAVVCDQPVSLEPDAEPAGDHVEMSLQQNEGGWGGWSSWGKSLLSSATSTVGQSLTSVKEKAGEALRLHRTSVGEEAQEEEEASEERKEGGGEVEDADPSGTEELSSSRSVVAPSRGVFSTITHAVQNTGKSVISGGLDALEFIGKKTMTVLAESDPGFKKTKTLMQRTMLKEAKERERARLSNQPISAPTAHYGILFDDYQGLSHLEALEILSNESEVKVQEFLSSLSEEEQDEMKKELIFIKEIFLKQHEEEEEGEENRGQTKDNGDLSSHIHSSVLLSADGEEFVSVLTELLFELHVAATPDKLNKARMKAHDWMNKVEQPVTTETVGRETQDEPGQASPGESKEEEEKKDGEQQEGGETKEGEKDGEIKESDPRSAEGVYLSLTCAMCKEVDCLAKRFSDTLLLVGGQRKAEDLNPLVDGVLLEGSNSTNYIHNAFQLLLPVLQISHIQSQRRHAAAEPAAQLQH